MPWLLDGISKVIELLDRRRCALRLTYNDYDCIMLRREWTLGSFNLRWLGPATLKKENQLRVGPIDDAQ